MYIAGIDLGTTGCKCAVFDSSGNMSGSHYVEYDLIFTPEGVEQDAGLWWEHVKTTLKKAVQSANIQPDMVKAIAAASQGIAFVPVDSEGLPLSRAISWYDRRADNEADEIAAHYGTDFLFEKCGRMPGSFLFPQVLHIKRHNPCLYEKTKYFLMAHDYIVFRLCGKAVTDFSMACGTYCFDTGGHKWLGEIFDHYGIDQGKFPILKPFGSIAGRILPRTALELGLSDDTVIAVGMQDQKAAALGAGITLHGNSSQTPAGSGIMTLSLGTASALLQLTNKKITDKNNKVLCHAFNGKRWTMENYVGASGSSLKWLRNTFFPELPYIELDALAAKSPSGAAGIIFNPALDTQYGSFSGISLNTTAGDMIRAVLEGVAYSVRRCVLEQQNLSGGKNPVSELKVFGGGAGSSIWCRILADVLDIPVSLPRTHECASLGAAVCAGLALGLFSDKAEIAGFIGNVRQRFNPDPANVRIYEKGYEKFCALC